jgi:hypothetical protein
LATHSDELVILEARDRSFHVEVLKGGMNRLLLRSNRSAAHPTRLEVFFINVKFMSIGTFFEGMRISDKGVVPNLADLDWEINTSQPIHAFEVWSKSGSGMIVAGGVETDESTAGPTDPSRFPMME